MSSDVIVGVDGKQRCTWAGAGDTALGRYHDEVWGTRTYDESALFEALTLGVFQVGLSWAIEILSMEHLTQVREKGLVRAQCLARRIRELRDGRIAPDDQLAVGRYEPG